MVTIRDVAKFAGVSAIAVSGVINKSGAVKSATRERVIKAIEELNWKSAKIVYNVFSDGEFEELKVDVFLLHI